METKLINMQNFSLERVMSALAFAGLSFSREEIALRSENSSGIVKKIGVIIDTPEGRQNSFCSACINELWEKGSLPFLFELHNKPDIFSLSSDTSFPFLTRNIVALDLVNLLKENDITGAVILLKHNGNLAPALGAVLHQAILLKKRSGNNFYGVIGYRGDEAFVEPFIASSLGVTPFTGEFLRVADDEAYGCKLAKLLLELENNNKFEYSIAEIVRGNLGNAVTTWVALGGSINWLLHFSFIAAIIGVELSFYDMAVLSKDTPMFIFSDNDKFTGTSERLLYPLFSRNCMEDTITVQGRWSELFELFDKDTAESGRYLPKMAAGGIILLKGNVCESVIIRKVDAASSLLESIKKGLFLVVTFSCQDIEENPGFNDETILYRLASSVEKEDVIGYVSIAAVEWQREIPRWRTLELIHLLKELFEMRVLRIILVVYGDGPLMSGLPVRNRPLVNADSFPLLKPVMLTLTDGIWGGEEGMILASPEAFKDRGLVAFETGDWCWVDLQEKRLELVDKQATKNAWKRGGDVVPMLPRIFMAREEFSIKVASLRKARGAFLPQLQIELENIEKKMQGLLPRYLSLSAPLEPFLIPELKRI